MIELNIRDANTVQHAIEERAQRQKTGIQKEQAAVIAKAVQNLKTVENTIPYGIWGAAKLQLAHDLDFEVKKAAEAKGYHIYNRPSTQRREGQIELLLATRELNEAEQKLSWMALW